jgi:type II secretory pathway predicted ATPase ExeA
MEKIEMYNECFLTEHQGNPLIEVLPPLVDDEAVIKRLRTKQECKPEQRELPAFIRKKFLHRMQQFVEPTYQYLECYRKLEDVIVQSYIPKNPKTNTGQYWLHHDAPEEARVIPSQGAFVSRATAMTIVGDGGSGKTWMIESCLRALGPQVIRHNSYKGESFKLTQVVWIKVICTENVNVGTLLLLILEELDRLTGTCEARNFNSKERVALASLAITKILKVIYLGVLVIDEIQHLSLVDAKARELFVQFLFNTLARAGVPIVFLGDQRIVDFLSSSLPVSRRAESQGTLFVNGFRDYEWDLFVEALWKYQWTSPATQFSEELSDCLFELSTGLPDFAVTIYKAAQDLVIGEDDEKISSAVLRQAYGVSCRFSHNGLEKRRHLQGSKAGRKNQHVIPISDVEFASASDSSGQTIKSKKSRKIYDVNRVQHEEFGPKIVALKENNFTLSTNPELNTLRKASDFPDPMKSLKESRILLRNSTLLTS